MNGLEQWIASLGFPIAITVYLLYRDSKILKDFTTAMNNNTEALIELKVLIQERLK